MVLVLSLGQSVVACDSGGGRRDWAEGQPILQMVGVECAYRDSALGADGEGDRIGQRDHRADAPQNRTTSGVDV